MSVRSALKTTIDALTLNSESVATFDHGSTQLCIDALERSVFSGLGVLMGDQRSDQEPYCHGWRLSVTEFDVLIAEKRQSNIGDFDTYMADLTAALSPSSLGIGNILSCDVTATSEVQHPIPSTWYLPVVVTVKHLIPVTLGSDFRLNAEAPSCDIEEAAIESWAAGGASGSLTVTVNTTEGTGGFTNIYLLAEVTSGLSHDVVKSFCFTTNLDHETTSIPLTCGVITGLASGDIVSFTAIVIDEYKLSGTSAAVSVTIA